MARKMKDSGIEWIGEIPEGWNIERGKNILSILERPVLSTDGVVTCFRDGEVTLRSKRREDGFTISLQEAGYQGIEPGDLVVHGMDGFAGAIGISDSRGKGTPVLNVLDSTQNKRFIMYYLRCAANCGLFLSLATGIRVRSCDTNWNKLKTILYLVPPLFEQHRIATYLDTQCAKIDAVLEQTRNSIEEYKKLKQSVITQAVTKGIRPGRKMKDSGIEWIGEVPEEWEVSKIKHISTIQPECDTTHLTEESLVTYAPMDCIKNGYFINNQVAYGTISASLTSFCNGDIVIAKVTPCFENGNIAIMDNLGSGIGFGSSELFVIRAKRMERRFLFYWLQNDLFKVQACATMTGVGGLKRVSPQFFRNASIVYPDTKEQLEIYSHLDNKLMKLNNLIGKKEEFYCKLESYKKSLIYECVTGKREV